MRSKTRGLLPPLQVVHGTGRHVKIKRDCLSHQRSETCSGRHRLRHPVGEALQNPSSLMRRRINLQLDALVVFLEAFTQVDYHRIGCLCVIFGSKHTCVDQLVLRASSVPIAPRLRSTLRRRRDPMHRVRRRLHLLHE
jgi:hypothetical protein